MDYSQLPKCEAWDQWLQSSGESVLDFSKFPYHEELPSPLSVTNEDGGIRQLSSVTEWEEWRTKIKRELEYWVTGSFPEPPSKVSAQVLERKGGKVSFEKFNLVFGKNDAAKIECQLWLPSASHPLPVFISTYSKEDWGKIALSRGYAVLLFAGSDFQDDTEALKELYPEHDFTQLGRRAWGASRCIDYLETRAEIDANHICISDHSRGGKMAAWAAAFDERITAVSCSSSVTGGTIPWRYSTAKDHNETLEIITRHCPHWFHPRLRFFVGREKHLPVDMHHLLALIAPRTCLNTLGLHEYETNVWGEEKGVEKAREVYDLYGRSEHLVFKPRPGVHRVSSENVHFFFDVFDFAFGQRGVAPQGDSYFPRPEGDKVVSSNDVNLQSRIRSLIGEPIADIDVHHELSLVEDEVASFPWTGKAYEHFLVGRPKSTARVARKSLKFGAGCEGDVYFPREREGDLSCVILLHPYSFTRGYSTMPIVPDDEWWQGETQAIWGHPDGQVENFISQGFAVFCFDQLGFGTRTSEYRERSARYPGTSWMSHLIDDLQSAVTMLKQVQGLRSDSINVMGYALGGLVGLLAAALKVDFHGLISIDSFTLLNQGSKRYAFRKFLAQEMALIPRMNACLDRESSVPFDFDEIVRASALEKLLLIAHEDDQDSDVPEIQKVLCQGDTALIDQSFKDDLWKNKSESRPTHALLTCPGPSGFTPDLQALVARWL